MPLRRWVKIERLNCVTSHRYFVRPGRRSGTWIWFDAEDVPSFEGDSAMLEIEVKKGGGWKVISPAT